MKGFKFQFEQLVTQRLLETAESRQTQLRGRVERGAQPRIDLVDNAGALCSDRSARHRR